MPSTTDKHLSQSNRLLVVDAKKVYVEVVDNESPVHIQPPISDVSTYSWDSKSSVSLHHQYPLLTSTPTPTTAVNNLVDDHENPFRSEGNLFREVEPIVEEFKHLPYPYLRTSRATLHNVQNENNLSKPTSTTSDPSIMKVQINQLQCSSSTSNGLARPNNLEFEQPKNKVVEVQRKVLAQPKAGNAQMVHVKDKKFCSCCSAD